MVFSPWVKATRATANIGVSALAVGLFRLQSPLGDAVDTDQESRKTPKPRSVPANVMLQLPNQIRLLNDSFLDQIPNR